jgi:hypothetical protein
MFFSKTRAYLGSSKRSRTRTVPLTFSIAVGLFLFSFAPLAHAQISPDRPGFGDGSTSMNAARFQVESGYGLGLQSGTASHSLGQLLLRYGLTDWLEARAGLGSYVLNGAPQTSGYNGTTLGAKASLLRDGPVSVGLQATTGLPTGTGPFSATRVWQRATLAASTPVAGPLAFATNVAHTFTYGQSLSGETKLTTTLLLSASETVGIGLGYAGFYTPGANRNYLEGGATYRAAPNTQLDVNWAYQLDGTNEVLLGLGVAQRF